VSFGVEQRLDRELVDIRPKSIGAGPEIGNASVDGLAGQQFDCSHSHNPSMIALLCVALNMIVRIKLGAVVIDGDVLAPGGDDALLQGQHLT
jgi:hypothetical protein